jgi:hypothetical protein
MKFHKLSKLAQVRAVFEYMKGWAETHGPNDLNFWNVYDMLLVDKCNEYEYNADGLLIDSESQEYISFSAELNGEAVRLTVKIEDLDIISRDNDFSFDTKTFASSLSNIEFEDIY